MQLKKPETIDKINDLTYYEDFDWEGSHLKIRLKDKIHKILETIPDNVKTIIDIGCGNGVITNELGKRYDVTGVDRSVSALRYVDTKKILSSSEKINVPDESFDIVFSSELLEHLRDNVFYRTINEMKRITKNYIFLTVPNDETVEKDLIKCPNCGWIFNKVYHLRRLNIKKIKKYFTGYKVIRGYQYGAGKRGYNRHLLKIKHKYAHSSSWIPNYWTKNSSRKALCPKCETTFNYQYRFSLLGSLCDILNIFFSPHKPYWLFILLEKSTDASQS